MMAAGSGIGLMKLNHLGAWETISNQPMKKIPIGVQLYSVREKAVDNLPDVLDEIAKMGYQGVEFAGYYGWENKPHDLRKLLDDNGLKCCGTHTALDTILGDSLKTTAELHSILGNNFLIVPSLSANSVQEWEDLAKTFNEISNNAKEFGMLVGYHSHSHDFRRLGNSTPWEIFFDNTSDDIIMQLDTGNCLDGNGDPVAILKKYPGRSTTIHLKEHGGPEGAVIGEGTVPWKEVFEICETNAGTSWYIVEHETGINPMQSIKGCLEGLHKMGRGK
jgi:sugar phosphate isomerase/epimerase